MALRKIHLIQRNEYIESETKIIDPPLPPFAPFGEVLLLLELKLTEPEPPLPDNRLI